MILVTGASGFLAESLLPRLKGKVRLLARNEGKLKELHRKYPKAEIVYGDIADPFIAERSMQGVKTVYHLAAFKHVRDAEDQSYECVKSNITGLLNLLHSARENSVKTFVFISTDKAAQISGVYGATKYIGEKLIEEYQKICSYTRFVVVRYGNIMHSTGSVMPLWRSLMKNKQAITITDPEMTRFYWTPKEAVDLIFEAVKKSPDAKPYTPTMKAMKLGDIVEAMMQKYGRVGMNIIGKQEGENMHETMDGKVFSNEVELYTIKEIKRKV